MESKPTLPDLSRSHKRQPWGYRRLKVHILILLLLAATLGGLGLYGRGLLKVRVESFTQSHKIDLLHAATMDETTTVMLGAAHSDEARALISRSSSARKRGLKTVIANGVAEGSDNAAITALVVQALGDELTSRLDDQAELQPIMAALQDQAEQIARRVDARVAEGLDSLSLQAVRQALPPSDANYVLMYYHVAMLAAAALFLALAAFLIYAWFAWDMDGKLRLAQILEPIDYLMPFLVGVVLFTLYPMIRVIVMSFQERFKLDGSFQGWGIGNYRYVLAGVEGTTNYFMQGLKNTLLYVLYTVPTTTALAIVIAYLINQKMRFSALFQTGYFLPMVTSITAVGLVWRWIYHRDYGLLNAILSLFGVERIAWLQQGSRSMPALVIFAIWSSLPFTIILLISGLQNIDENYYTVARVDGAKAWRIFRRITLPLLAPTVGLVLTINSISAFKVFTEVTVLFNGQPGPAKNMYTVVYYIFEVMRGEALEYGRAASAAIVLFLLILIFTLLQRYIQRKWSYT